MCKTADASRTFLAALSPAHRLRLLTLVACERVGKAYSDPEAKGPLAAAKRLESLVRSADSGEYPAAFGADPLVALQCLNHDKGRALNLFSAASADVRSITPGSSR